MCLGKLVDTSWVVPNTKIPDDGSAGHPTDGGLLPRWNRFVSVFRIRIPPDLDPHEDFLLGSETLVFIFLVVG